MQHPAASPVVMGQTTEWAFSLADDAVISEVEQLPTEPTPAGATVSRNDIAWRDTRPLLDEREHAPQVIDMVRLALAYGTARRLLAWHPTQPHLVRIARHPIARWDAA